MLNFFKNIENIMIIVAGVSALGVGYASFAASLWDSQSLELYSKANAALTDANTTHIDRVVQQDDLSSSERAKLDSDYTQQFEQSELFIQQADSANKSGDTFQLVVVYFTIILFLSSLFSSTKHQSARRGLLLASLLVLIGAVIQISLMRLPG